MRLEDIDVHVLLKTVKVLPDVFTTKDVSEHSDMLRAHPDAKNQYQYRRWHFRTPDSTNYKKPYRLSGKSTPPPKKVLTGE